MTVSPKVWLTGGLVVALAGAYVTGCLVERAGQAAERARVQQAADSTIARLRADSAAQRALAERLAQDAAAAKADRDAAKRDLDRATAKLAGLTAQTKLTETALADAKDAADSLLKYPPLVANLRAELAGTQTALAGALTTIRADSVAYLKLQAIDLAHQRETQTAEAKAAALARMNDQLRGDLAAANRKWSFGWKLSTVTGAAAAVGIVCLATTVC